MANLISAALKPTVPVHLGVARTSLLCLGKRASNRSRCITHFFSNRNPIDAPIDVSPNFLVRRFLVKNHTVIVRSIAFKDAVLEAARLFDADVLVVGRALISIP